MLVQLTRTLLVAGASVPAPSGATVDVDDSYGKDLVAAGLATAVAAPETKPEETKPTETKPTGPEETKPTGPKETK